MLPAPAHNDDTAIAQQALAQHGRTQPLPIQSPLLPVATITWSSSVNSDTPRLQVQEKPDTVLPEYVLSKHNVVVATLEAIQAVDE